MTMTPEESRDFFLSLDREMKLEIMEDYLKAMEILKFNSLAELALSRPLDRGGLDLNDIMPLKNKYLSSEN